MENSKNWFVPEAALARKVREHRPGENNEMAGGVVCNNNQDEWFWSSHA